MGSVLYYLWYMFNKGNVYGQQSTEINPLLFLGDNLEKFLYLIFKIESNNTT